MTKALDILLKNISQPLLPTTQLLVNSSFCMAVKVRKVMSKGHVVTIRAVNYEKTQNPKFIQHAAHSSLVWNLALIQHPKPHYVPKKKSKRYIRSHKRATPEASRKPQNKKRPIYQPTVTQIAAQISRIQHYKNQPHYHIYL